MSNKNSLIKHKQPRKRIYYKNKKINQGFLAKIWGNSTNIPYNIAALTIIILIVSGVLYTYLNMNLPSNKVFLPIKDFWSIITPIITLAIGYLFNEKSK